jgi:hypothetical protein
LTISGYAKLVTCLNHYINRPRPNTRNNGSAKSLATEFLLLKNPGKKIRRWLEKTKRKDFDLSKTTNITTFLGLTGLEYPLTNNGLTVQVTVWSMGGFSNWVRVFLIKFYNNISGLNTRISHFVPNQS